MNDYVPGALSQSFLGIKNNKKNNHSSLIDAGLDALFKSSAGPCQIPPPQSPSITLKNEVASDHNNISDKLNSKNNAITKNRKEINRIDKDRKNESLAKKKTRNHTNNISNTRRSKVDLTIEEKYESTRLKKQNDQHRNINFDKEKETEKEHNDEDNVSQEESSEDVNTQINNNEKKDVAEDDSDNDDDDSSIKKKEAEEKEKTIFVGNLPVSVIEKHNYRVLKKKFSEFGKILSIRFRSIAFSEPLPRKIAFKLGKLHPERDILNAYVVYQEKESTVNALSMNAQLFLDKHLRVDSVANPKTYDRKRTIFIGALAFDAQEEQLWHHFKDCGEIESVRIVRDKKTNVGKGFAYVQFKERASVSLSLNLHLSKIGTRTIRVTRYSSISPNNNNITKNKHKLIKRKGGKEVGRGGGVNSHKKSGIYKPKTKRPPRIRERTVAWKKTNIKGKNK
ncbi:435_t:CDS:2 [Ambispora gerdemannii]|uniref:Nucleolar protein 12 n=1 Tax=Ambispora gerdemannii TaxID=144530 RepID=A0A9N9AEM5_9GLOM|nr:435_t:CDS:2 [Ambispora gerdemannii]